MSDPLSQTPSKTPRKKAVPSQNGRTEEELERFKSWLDGNSFKSNGGFLPHLRKIMNNPELPTYSKASFHKQPKDGYKLVWLKTSRLENFPLLLPTSSPPSKSTLSSIC